MLPGRRAAVALWSALTFSFAVLVHGVIHAAGSASFAWDSPAHVAMLGGAVGLLVLAAVQLGVLRSPAERRRRVALVRAALGRSRATRRASTATTQLAIAATLLLAEGASLEPERLVTALLCGLLALACSTFVFRAAGHRVAGLLVSVVAAAGVFRAAPLLRRRTATAPCTTEPFRLFIPNRPPPLPR